MIRCCIFGLFAIFYCGPILGMTLQEAYSDFKSGNYVQLLSQNRDGDVAKFCKRFAIKMREEKTTLIVPDWVNNACDADESLCLLFSSVAKERAGILMNTWNPDAAQVWFDFSKDLGGEDLSEEEKNYISDMKKVLQEQQNVRSYDYEDLLDGIDKMEALV